MSGEYAGATGQPNDYPDEARQRTDADVQRAAAALAGATGEAESAWQARAAEARALEAANDATLMQLAARHRVGVPLDQMLRIHLTVLLDHALGDRSAPRRIEYDLDVAQRVRDMLAETESQVTRSKLLDGVRLDGNGRPA